MIFICSGLIRESERLYGFGSLWEWNGIPAFDWEIVISRLCGGRLSPLARCFGAWARVLGWEIWSWWIFERNLILMHVNIIMRILLIVINQTKYQCAWWIFRRNSILIYVKSNLRIPLRLCLFFKKRDENKCLFLKENEMNNFFSFFLYLVQ